MIMRFEVTDKYSKDQKKPHELDHNESNFSAEKVV